MKKMQIFEPAMCCSTGVCGVGVDPELLRLSTVLNALDKNGVKVDRFNLSSNPQEFITNKVINTCINEKGVAVLPVTVVEGEIVITGRYPTNEEFIKLLEVPQSALRVQRRILKVAPRKSNGCGCSGGNCC